MAKIFSSQAELEKKNADSCRRTFGTHFPPACSAKCSPIHYTLSSTAYRNIKYKHPRELLKSSKKPHRTEAYTEMTGWLSGTLQAQGLPGGEATGESGSGRENQSRNTEDKALRNHTGGCQEPLDSQAIFPGQKRALRPAGLLVSFCF